MDLLSGYIEELKQDTYIDEFNVKDKQMMLPGIKHKWAGRQVRAKIKIKELFHKRRKLISELTDKLIAESPVTLSKPVAENKVKETESVVTINKSISNLEIVIEFLEKTDKTLSSMTFDIRNLTELMKLELQ